MGRVETACTSRRSAVATHCSGGQFLEDDGGAWVEGVSWRLVGVSGSSVWTFSEDEADTFVEVVQDPVRGLTAADTV